MGGKARQAGVETGFRPLAHPAKPTCHAAARRRHAARPAEPRAASSAAEHRFPVRVYFEDTDLSGVVYHANYLRFMERARSDMLRLAGVDQRGHHDAGAGAYAVTRLAIRYRAPARLDDALVVASRVLAVRAASVDIQQTVRRGQTILTEADVDRRAGRTVGAAETPAGGVAGGVPGVARRRRGSSS